MRAWALGAFAAWTLALPASASAQVNVTTYHNDNARTGQNQSETILTPANVNSTSFGLLFARVVDGAVYAQPLYLSDVTVPGVGRHNLVFVATEHDSVYAFDADSQTGRNAFPLWQASLIPPGGSPIPYWAIGNNLYPGLGITGTPVIDAQSGTLYAVSNTLENGAYAQRLHALDVRTGRERFGGPVPITAQAPGYGDGSVGGILTFSPLFQMNRSGLLLSNGVVYLPFGSHGDVTPYHGWLIGYDAHTLQKVGTFVTTPDGLTDPSGYPIGGGAIWQAGGAPAADSAGNIFFETANGTFDAATGGPDYADSFVKLSSTAGLRVADYFTPYNEQLLDDYDADLGSGGLLLLPDSVGSADHPHLLVGCGKEGTVYLVDRDQMGGFNSAADTNLQALYYSIGGTWSSPAYFNSAIYYNGVGDVLRMLPVGSGALATSPQSVSSTALGYPGATPSVSANGVTGGIVWTIDSALDYLGLPAVLHAYDATNVATELYNSSQLAEDAAGPAVEYTVPTVANGKVFVGGQGSLSVYGERP